VPAAATNPLLTIRVTFPSGGVSLVRLSGELDMSCAAELAHTLASLALGGSGGVIVDVSELEFIDSIGIHTLGSAATALAEKGRTFEVVGATRNVRRVFEIANVLELLSVESANGDGG
jgi:anti-sigma B factor antagonist